MTHVTGKQMLILLLFALLLGVIAVLISADAALFLAAGFPFGVVYQMARRSEQTSEAMFSGAKASGKYMGGYPPPPPPAPRRFQTDAEQREYYARYQHYPKA